MGAIVSQLLLVFVIGCGVVAHPPFCGALMDSHAPTGEEGTPRRQCGFVVAGLFMAGTQRARVLLGSFPLTDRTREFMSL